MGMKKSKSRIITKGYIGNCFKSFLVILFSESLSFGCDIGLFMYLSLI